MKSNQMLNIDMEILLLTIGILVLLLGIISCCHGFFTTDNRIIAREDNQPPMEVIDLNWDNIN